MPITVDVPGGSAVLRDPTALRVKHKREIQLHAADLGEPLIRQLSAAIKAGQVEQVQLTRDQNRTLLLMNEATVFALLESWTLDEPLPRSADDVGDMLADVYEALMAECMRINVGDGLVDSDGNVVDPFEVGAVEHPDSPTGASVGSGAPSTVVARRRAPSDHAKPSGTRSTGTVARSR